MRGKQIAVCTILGLLVTVFATGCADFNRNWLATYQTLHEGEYKVVGRVTDVQSMPIDNTKVCLIKQFYRGKDRTLDRTKPTDKDSVQAVVKTDATGEFLLSFELRSADSVWLYIDGSEEGYEGRFVNLNERMGDSIFDYPGNTPLSVHVVLEKQGTSVADSSGQ